MTDSTVFSYQADTIEDNIQAALVQAAQSDGITQVVIHCGSELNEASVRRALKKMTPARVAFELDMAINPRVYHNGTRVLEIALENYIIRNGWRREYVGIARWQAEELRFAGLNAS